MTRISWVENAAYIWNRSRFIGGIAAWGLSVTIGLSGCDGSSEVSYRVLRLVSRDDRVTAIIRRHCTVAWDNPCDSYTTDHDPNLQSFVSADCGDHWVQLHSPGNVPNELRIATTSPGRSTVCSEYACYHYEGAELQIANRLTDSEINQRASGESGDYKGFWYSIGDKARSVNRSEDQQPWPFKSSGIWYAAGDIWDGRKDFVTEHRGSLSTDVDLDQPPLDIASCQATEKARFILAMGNQGILIVEEFGKPMHRGVGPVQPGPLKARNVREVVLATADPLVPGLIITSIPFLRGFAFLVWQGLWLVVGSVFYVRLLSVSKRLGLTKASDALLGFIVLMNLTGLWLIYGFSYERRAWVARTQEDLVMEAAIAAITLAMFLILSWGRVRRLQIGWRQNIALILSFAVFELVEILLWSLAWIDQYKLVLLVLVVGGIGCTIMWCVIVIDRRLQILNPGFE